MKDQHPQASVFGVGSFISLGSGIIDLTFSGEVTMRILALTLVLLVSVNLCSAQFV